ncbi:hypothetical protein [Streptomyces sp. NPDC007991]|uniref:hypothetical protein n=1 Tax=Streptomyces sp. NPDC007991 TaxID=3364803 RepID=UPI0036E923C5
MATLGDPTPPRQRRSLFLRTGLRALVTATLLVLCLAVFVAVLAWRIRGITRSHYPGLRAIETLAVAVPLYILAFATTYLSEDSDVHRTRQTTLRTPDDRGTAAFP